jgi:hypothetical protein
MDSRRSTVRKSLIEMASDLRECAPGRIRTCDTGFCGSWWVTLGVGDRHGPLPAQYAKATGRRRATSAVAGHRLARVKRGQMRGPRAELQPDLVGMGPRTLIVIVPLVARAGLWPMPRLPACCRWATRAVTLCRFPDQGHRATRRLVHDRRRTRRRHLPLTVFVIDTTDTSRRLAYW